MHNQISVIIPTYNRADSLSFAIESVQNQTYKNWQLIVVDDASIDNTKTIVDHFQDSRIHYIQQAENKGPSNCRHRGLEAATGEFVCFLDSDDIFVNDYFEIFIKRSKRLSQIDCFYGDLDWGNCGIVTSHSHKAIPYIDNLSCCQIFVKNQFLKKNNIQFEEQLRSGENWFFSLRLHQHRCKFHHIKKTIAFISRNRQDHLSLQSTHTNCEFLIPLTYLKKFTFPKANVVVLIKCLSSSNFIFLVINQLRLFLKVDFDVVFMITENTTPITKNFIDFANFIKFYQETDFLEFLKKKNYGYVMSIEDDIVITSAFRFPKIKEGIRYYPLVNNQPVPDHDYKFFETQFLPRPTIILKACFSNTSLNYCHSIFYCSTETFLASPLTYKSVRLKSKLLKVFRQSPAE